MRVGTLIVASIALFGNTETLVASESLKSIPKLFHLVGPLLEIKRVSSFKEKQMSSTEITTAVKHTNKLSPNAEIKRIAIRTLIQKRQGVPAGKIDGLVTDAVLPEITIQLISAIRENKIDTLTKDGQRADPHGDKLLQLVMLKYGISNSLPYSDIKNEKSQLRKALAPGMISEQEIIADVSTAIRNCNVMQSGNLLRRLRKIIPNPRYKMQSTYRVFRKPILYCLESDSHEKLTPEMVLQGISLFGRGSFERHLSDLLICRPSAPMAQI
jgi:hypothetical protein